MVPSNFTLVIASVVTSLGCDAMPVQCDRLTNLTSSKLLDAHDYRSANSKTMLALETGKMDLSTVAIGTRCMQFLSEIINIRDGIFNLQLSDGLTLSWHELNAVVLYLATDRQT